MEEGMNVIELDGVVKDYGDFKLDRVSFAVPEGSVCGFIGQNGAGKTTTIQLILDAIRRDAGEIRVFGESIDRNRQHCVRKSGLYLMKWASMIF